MNRDTQVMNRWRLILGRHSSADLEFTGSGNACQKMDASLEFLYGREYGALRGMRMRSGGDADSLLEVPEWINTVRSLFPKPAVEILERHALHKYGLTELLTDAEVLEQLEPNPHLLVSILQMKHLMNKEVTQAARKIIRRVVDDIRKSLETSVRNSILGRIDKKKSSVLKSGRNLDLKRTINKNLKNYDQENNRLCIEQVYFYQNSTNFIPWQIILVIDQSGSMLESVIHSAVMAGIFAGLPVLRIKLLVFDTEVVDLSGHALDPVETLMRIQLGGGTRIHKALQYGYGLMEQPARTLFILLSDLYEGGRPDLMYKWTADILESGAKMIALTSLDKDANPAYDHAAGERMAQLGASVAALTPEELGKWISHLISG